MCSVKYLLGSQHSRLLKLASPTISPQQRQHPDELQSYTIPTHCSFKSERSVPVVIRPSLVIKSIFAYLPPDAEWISGGVEL
jgi:hypothetical protein